MEMPAVSVIIPMFNSEKYVGECLESLLAQSFQDFEVIVIDDCSTDNGSAIVESYIPRFDEKLRLVKTKKNSGGSASRNKGMKLSRGEYLFFMDSDDLFTKTALEYMYKPAKEFNADVIYCGKYYSYNDKNKETRVHSDGVAMNKITLELNKQLEHLTLYASDKYFWAPWTKFVRRNWAVENNILFQRLPRAQDFLWTLKIFTYAERFVRIPTPIYLYRNSPSSITRSERSDSDMMNFWISPVIKGLKEIGDFMNSVEILKQNPPLRYAIIDFFATVHIGRDFLKLSLKFPPEKIYENFKQEFGEELGNEDVLVSYFCTRSNSLLKASLKLRQRIVELENEINRLKNRGRAI